MHQTILYDKTAPRLTSMPFIEHFELLNLIHYDVVETWLTRESGSGRKLLLHRYPKESGLRERLQSMPLNELAMVLKAGEDGGYFFVVTQDTPDFRQFLSWVERLSVPEPPVELEEPATPVEPGEFTRMFRTPANPSPTASKVAETQARKSAAEPGEFTQMFKGPVPAQRPAPAAPPQPPLTPANAQEPGEFTRLFKNPAPQATPATAIEKPHAAPAAPLSAPGDFTQMFGRNNPSPPARDASVAPLAAAQKSAAEPGELTRLFKGPAVPPQRPAPPVPAAGGQQPSEFTKFFNSPLPETPLAARLEKPQAEAKPAAPSSESGDFTKMFGRPSQNPGPASLAAPRASDAGGVTGIFSKKNTFESATPQEPVASGLGEYTRMFQPAHRPAEGSADSSAPARAEQKPAPSAQPAATRQRQSTPIALVIVLAAIAVVAIALILYFVIKR
jgi:hypothetical protein